MESSQTSTPFACIPMGETDTNESTTSLRATLTLSFVTFIAMVPVTMLVAPLKELIALRFGSSAFWTHSFMSINMIGAILASPILIMLSDRHAMRKRVAGLALGADALLLIAMSFPSHLTPLLVIRFFEGAAHILALSTLMAMASTLAGKTHRGRTMGIVGAAMMFGTAAGTRIGGLVWLYSPNWIFHLAGLTAAVAACYTFLIVSEPIRSRSPNERPRGAVLLLRKNPSLLIAFAYALIDRLCVGVVISTFTLFLADCHGLNPNERSHLLLAFLLPFALSVYPAGRLVDRIGRVWPIAIGSIAFGILFASYGLLPLNNLPIAMILSGLFSAIMFAPNLTLCTDLVPVSQRGVAFTGFNVAGSLGFVMGPLLAGGLFTLFAAHGSMRFAYNATLFATGATEILCALITLPLLLKLKRSGITR